MDITAVFNYGSCMTTCLEMSCSFGLLGVFLVNVCASFPFGF